MLKMSLGTYNLASQKPPDSQMTSPFLRIAMVAGLHIFQHSEKKCKHKNQKKNHDTKPKGDSMMSTNFGTNHS